VGKLLSAFAAEGQRLSSDLGDGCEKCGSGTSIALHAFSRFEPKKGDTR
jgi:hypothetical protein